jgi:hypothetical protein
MMTHSTHTNHYLKGLALLAAGLLALFVSSMSVVGEQSDSQKGIPGSGKKDSGVAIQNSSTAAKATFASGSGLNFLGVKVSNHGNLLASSLRLAERRSSAAVRTTRSAARAARFTPTIPGISKPGSAPLRSLSRPRGRSKYRHEEDHGRQVPAQAAVEQAGCYREGCHRHHDAH